MAINESLSKQLNKILNKYADECDETIEKEIDAVAKDTVQNLKNNSPKRSGDYAASWSVKKAGGKFGRVVYNKNHYRLTHLLNNGHVIRNKYGTYGRVNGDNHIGKAEQEATEQLIDELERKL